MIHTTKVIDAPRAQYVAIPPNLLSHPRLPALPTPAYTDSAKCAGGCYSNAQVRDLIDAALQVFGTCTDQLDAIRALSARAVDTNADNHARNDHGNQDQNP